MDSGTALLPDPVRGPENARSSLLDGNALVSQPSAPDDLHIDGAEIAVLEEIAQLLGVLTCHSPVHCDEGGQIIGFGPRTVSAPNA
jgi:hypothetical protein